jgi:ATP-dependent Clp protease ATP-binding subunit ClpA
MSALQDAGRVLQLARREAAERNSPCIETTDLLLALTREKEFSDRFPGPVEALRKRRAPEPGPPREKVSAADLPFSEDSKLAFTFAAQEAAQLGQRTGPGHLLLGILRVESCAATEILRECGLTEAGIRAQLQLRPPPPSSDPEQGRNYV